MTSRQLTVTVDHDSDETRIEVVDPRATPRRQFVVVKTKYPSQVLEVLENVQFQSPEEACSLGSVFPVQGARPLSDSKRLIHGMRL